MLRIVADIGSLSDPKRLFSDPDPIQILNGIPDPDPTLQVFPDPDQNLTFYKVKGIFLKSFWIDKHLDWLLFSQIF